MPGKYIPPGGPGNDLAVPMFVTEDGYKFFLIDNQWVDNHEPEFVDMTFPNGPDNRPVFDSKPWHEVVSRVEQYVKDATGWAEFDAEQSMVSGQIQELYDDIESDK